ncbi:hypothetical protein BKA66DRAFT_431365 [Pyrenochaeta sp. MPI-SDFR-AT-0127]|nr:hypothetical protein BKA66DRAFT_431365 [Pyrenochaeta sp. MPI-SDFR-AT-0127]
MEYVLICLGTYIPPTPESNSSWSKESIVALATIFIMLLLSSIGLICKYHQTPISFRVWSLKRYIELMVEGDQLPEVHRPANGLHWVDMADVRRYQQETYSSLIRLRNGPRTSIPPRQSSRGRP